MITGLLFAGVVPATAWAENEIATVIAAVEEFNRTHGGTGALIVTFGYDDNGFEAMVITGEVTGATRGLALPFNVVWQAKLSGDPVGGEALINGSLVIMPGAEITTSGRAIETYGVRMAGGTITAAEAIYALDDGFGVAIQDGVVNGDINFVHTISGGTINGSFAAHRIAGGTINAPALSAFNHLTIEGDARVSAECVVGLENTVTSIAPTAAVDFEDRLNNFIRNDNPDLTIVGNVTLSRELFVCSCIVIPGQSFWSNRITYIPVGSTLTVTNPVAFQLKGNNTTLIIDGTLNLPANFDFSNWNGVVMGDNAGNLAGTWVNGERNPQNGSSSQPCTRWYTRVPRFLHWILRWVLFGWAWMCC